jgi:flagellar hook-associated protein FlgK
MLIYTANIVESVYYTRTECVNDTLAVVDAVIDELSERVNVSNSTACADDIKALVTLGEELVEDVQTKNILKLL